MPYSDISDSQFSDKVESAKGKCIVYFWAPWCAPCKGMAPVYSATSDEMTNVSFYKVNSDENQEYAGKYNVMALPTLILFKDGEEVDRSVGAMAKPALIEWVKSK